MTLSEPLPSEPRRIFILRPDNLGDLVLFSGSLECIRNRWPLAHITLCTRAFGRELFKHCPHVDKFIAFESLKWIGRIHWPLWFLGTRSVPQRLLQACLALLPGFGYDLSILPVASPWINYHRIMQFIPARHRVGICGSSDNLNASQQQFYKEIYSRQMDASPFAWNLPELERNRMFLQFLGIHASAEDNWPKFWTESTDRDAADRLFAGLTEGCVIGIAPGISWPLGKRLPARWYAETLQKLQISDVHTVLLGSSQDSEICAEIETFLLHDRFNAKVINLAGKTTPLQLVECIRRCDLLLCADAAPLHIATAMRKPVVGILGGGHYGRFYPWGDPKLANVVNNPLDCYGCNWQCKYDTVRCIQEIPPADATQKLKDLFEYVLQTDKAETTNSIIL